MKASTLGALLLAVGCAASHAELVRDARWVEACQMSPDATMERYVADHGDELRVEVHALGDDAIGALLPERPEKLAGLVVLRWRRPLDGALKARFTGVELADGRRYPTTTDAFDVLGPAPEGSHEPPPSGQTMASPIAALGGTLLRGVTLGLMDLPLREGLESVVGRARGAWAELHDAPAVRRHRATRDTLIHLLGEHECTEAGGELRCEEYVALLPATADPAATEDVATLTLAAEYFGDEYCDAEERIVIDLPPGESIDARVRSAFAEPLSASAMW